ncbi:MAG TPA: acetyl ornithine aminotransferase family protein [Candidatus Dormibacteraeota bacterium]|nr:acetyl ornithine aminotransferase family protein [Candidatus Dormibacteraeota bacterium]
MIEAAMDTKLPRVRMPLPGPLAKEAVALDERYISPSCTRSYPLVARRGHGAMIEDVDGNVFLDFAAGIAVVATGHCHPKVVEAIQRQAAELIHISGTDFYYPQLTELAARLEKITPGSEPKRVFYSNSGAETIEAAIKLARYATGRDKLIAFHGCFHGRTNGALSLTASKAVQRKGFGTLLSGVFHMPYPNPYRCPFGAGAHDCGDDCIEYLEKVLFKKLVDPEEVAAVFIEPVQGEGGYIPAPKKFLHDLAALCKRHGILLVADEVQSGMGRTGKWWASDHSGIEPDIICIAKGIASGMPLGVTVARASLMQWKPGAHASTFGGNPVSLAAALATIDLLESEYLENSRRVGEYMMNRMKGWTGRFRTVGDVRGLGLMLGIEFVTDRQGRAPAPDLRDRVVESAFQKGLLVLGAGESTLRLSPPLMIDTEQADFALDTLEASIAEVERAA